jgi:predicted N-acetyltransferase YhbS
VESEIREADFETVRQIWHEHLWPGRISKIEEISWISIEGKIDPKITDYTAKFFAAYVGSQLAGVISCHRVSPDVTRLRGLFVMPQFRKQRIGTSLINQVKIQSRKEGAKMVFELVRETNQKYYRLNGFRPYKKQDGYEFGPHVIMFAG